MPRIGQDVDERKPDTLGVCHDRRKLRIEVHGHWQYRTLRRVHGANRVLAERVDVHRRKVERDRPFSDHVRLVHQITVDSFANAMPFAELVRGIGQTASQSQNPIFDVRFALQNHPVPDLEMKGLSLKLRMRSTGTPRFDLGCEITEQGAELEVVWLFRENLFSQAEIEELGRLFRTVVESVCRVPERRTAALTN